VLSADGAPTSPAAALERADAASLATFTAEIAAARKTADLVVVALHKGITHTPARLAPYERPISHAAIDAGADVVVGHHAHIARGIELHRGKPIFHGLGNGCVVTRALGRDQAHPARAAWARRRRELFGFEPDPAYPLAPFHPEAVNGLLARIRATEDGRIATGFVPVFVEPPGRPVVAAGERGRSVVRYLERITAEAGLPPLAFQLDGECAWIS
jgi:poly-gamma-glutamate synthesis protein (capsule biosynthesis protein)